MYMSMLKNWETEIEQTPTKLIFYAYNRSSRIYGEFDRGYFDEYNTDGLYNKVSVDSYQIFKMFKLGHSSTYRFQIPYNQGEYLKVRIEDEDGNDINIGVRTKDFSIEKPFFMKDSVPFLKDTNTPLTTCLILSKLDLKKISFFKRYDHINVIISDTLTVEDEFNDVIMSDFDVKIMNNPSPFTNKYDSRFLSILRKFEVPPTIYTARGSPLLCINNFQHHRISLIIPHLTTIKSKRKAQTKKVEPE